MHSREFVSTLFVPTRPFASLLNDVVVLGQQLARDVERDGVRAVLGDDRGEAVGDVVERRVPADALERRVARRAQLRHAAAAASRIDVGGRGQVQRAALACRAGRSSPDGRGRRARRRCDRPVGLDDDAAADAAVRAGRARSRSSGRPASTRGSFDAGAVPGSTIVMRAGIAGAGRGRRALRSAPSPDEAGQRVRRHVRRGRTARAVQLARVEVDAAAVDAHRERRRAALVRRRGRGRPPRPMLQLCSGQATRSPNTMPCDSGPPLCGQRSSSANTRSSAVRKIATSPPLCARHDARAEHRDVVDRADVDPAVHRRVVLTDRHRRRTGARRSAPCRARCHGIGLAFASRTAAARTARGGCPRRRATRFFT